MEMSRDNDRIRKESPYMEMSLDNYQKVCVYKEIELQNHSSTFIHNNKSPPSATTILSSSPMAYNTTAPLDKPTCSDYVHSGKCQDRFGRFSWFKYVSDYLDVKLNVFEKDDNKEFPLVQKLTMGEADFNQLMQLRNQLVLAAEDFARKGILSPVLILTISNDKDEKLKLAHEVVDVVDRANEKICAKLLWYNMDKPD